MPQPTPLHEVTTAAGATFVEEAGWLIPAHFGGAPGEYRQARTAAVLFDQSNRGKVEVAGPDAPTFLHNLTTNNFKDLPPGRGREAFLTNATARVIGHAFVYRLVDERPVFWMDLTPGQAEKVMAHLDHYLISEQVELTNRSRDFGQLLLVGPEAGAVLARALGDNTSELEDGQVVTHPFGGGAAGQIRRNDSLNLPAFELVCPPAMAETLWRQLTAAGAVPAGREAFEILRIEAGLPVQGMDADDTTFAPEVGRIAQAISYTKGCYLGQEPIVMARDRGQVNRTLMGLKCPSGPVPSGSLLYRNGKEVGRVTSSAISPRLGMGIALAYVRRGNQEPGTVLEVEVGGQRQAVEVCTLPLPD
jgi:folate-binding protein YgfZ